MQFTQTGPTVAEAVDGSIVELVDRYHAKLVGPGGTWLVELKPAEDADWLAVELYADSIRRPGPRSEEGDSHDALRHLVTGLRALRLRVRIEGADAVGDDVRWV